MWILCIVHQAKEKCTGYHFICNVLFFVHLLLFKPCHSSCYFLQCWYILWVGVFVSIRFFGCFIVDCRQFFLIHLQHLSQWIYHCSLHLLPMFHLSALALSETFGLYHCRNITIYIIWIQATIRRFCKSTSSFLL